MGSPEETDAEASPAADPAEVECFNQIFTELLTSLRDASWVFTYHDSSMGAEHACRAVGRYLYRLDLGAELAIPFLQLTKAFEDLQKGIAPPLFKRGKNPSERDRSSERKFHQMWAAALLDALMERGEDKAIAAARVARCANAWPNFRSQKLSATTIDNWRDAISASERAERRQYEEIRYALSVDPNAKLMIEAVLKHGPPGSRREGRTWKYPPDF